MTWFLLARLPSHMIRFVEEPGGVSVSRLPPRFCATITNDVIARRRAEARRQPRKADPTAVAVRGKMLGLRRRGAACILNYEL